MKINVEYKNQLLINLYDRYVEDFGQSLFQLQDKVFLATATDGYGVSNIRQELNFYLKELESRGLLRKEKNLQYTLTKAGFNRAYTLKHPFKSFASENKQLVATIFTSILITIATVIVTLWSGVFANLS
ncbi:hypothetical protein [Vibrio vulnificus]|uniref:hypothetical protein n=1 Tax=Vibrio vulnificus TaxID=672 RepID=UPI00102882DB|nr:hypothetical protein [Vibrio vulnificus]ELI0612318.1 hypothetical protein [Vibrio vulnificus]MCU8273676.1 hypothetical protein [Vibrio vulnificus]RZQ09261.1 hypothetical protein D8T46_21405 [Vibrio vulnificus]